VDRHLVKELKVWERVEKREYEDELNVRKKLIEIKKDIRNSPVNSIEKKSKFFNKEHR
jgi:hypothetical protein